MTKILLVFENYNELVQSESALKKIGFDVVGITNDISLGEKVLGFNPDAIVVNGAAAGRVSVLSVGVKLKENQRWPGKVILVFNETQLPSSEDLMRIRADQILPGPLSTPTLISAIAEVLGQDSGALLERLSKYSMGLDSSAQDEIRVRGFPSEAEENRTQELFSDVNVAALMEEIQGESYQSSGIEFEPPRRVSEPSSSEMQNLDPGRYTAELHEEGLTLASRVQGYEKYTKLLKPPEQRVLPRIETHKAQREMKGDWDQEKLKNIDRERRKYTNLLFDQSRNKKNKK